MIQRLLRGRFLYLVFGALLAASYLSAWTRSLQHPGVPAGIVRAPTRGLPAPHREAVRQAGVPGEPPGREAASRSLEWWPRELDLSTLRQLTVREPLLAAALWILMMGAAGLAVAGVALSVWVVWSGRIRSLWRFTSLRLPAWSFGELGRITLLVLMMAGFLPLIRYPPLSHWMGGGDLDVHLRLIVSMLLLDVFAILTIVAFAQGKGTSVWRALGLSSRTWAASMAVGFRSYIAVFPWMFFLLFVVVEGARTMGFKPPIEPIQELIFQEGRPVVLGLTALLACVIGPAAEELFFRGVVYTAIRRRTSWMVAMFTSGTLFALMHANLVGFPSLLVLGCLLGHVYERTGTLASSLAVHVAHNAFLLSIALVLRRLVAVG